MPRDSSRLQKELREIAADPKSGVTARVKDESDFSKLEGTIQGTYSFFLPMASRVLCLAYHLARCLYVTPGPSWTPYQGGTFHVRATFVFSFLSAATALRSVDFRLSC